MSRTSNCFRLRKISPQSDQRTVRGRGFGGITGKTAFDISRTQIAFESGNLRHTGRKADPDPRQVIRDKVALITVAAQSKRIVVRGDRRHLREEFSQVFRLVFVDLDDPFTERQERVLNEIFSRSGFWNHLSRPIRTITLLQAPFRKDRPRHETRAAVDNDVLDILTIPPEEGIRLNNLFAEDKSDVQVSPKSRMSCL